MKKRCDNPTDSAYHKYGAKGITYCERWRSFENFFEDMGACPTGYSIERKDVNGNYEPGNCEWIPLKKQARNRTSNRYVTYKGETKMVVEWSEYLGMEYRILYSRLFTYNWPVDLAFETPVVFGQKVMKK
jgi:hypothetical protein